MRLSSVHPHTQFPFRQSRASRFCILRFVVANNTTAGVSLAWREAILRNAYGHTDTSGLLDLEFESLQEKRGILWAYLSTPLLPLLPRGPAMHLDMGLHGRYHVRSEPLVLWSLREVLHVVVHDYVRQ